MNCTDASLAALNTLMHLSSPNFDTLPQAGKKLGERLCRLGTKVLCTEVVLNSLKHAEKILNERDITIICPIPLPEDGSGKLYNNDIQAELNEIFLKYLCVRGHEFVKAKSDIYTVLVLDAPRDEMVKLGQFFYQAFLIHSAKGKNEMIYPRHSIVTAMKGEGWSNAGASDPCVTLPFADGEELAFTFHLKPVQ